MFFICNNNLALLLCPIVRVVFSREGFCRLVQMKNGNGQWLSSWFYVRSVRMRRLSEAHRKQQRAYNFSIGYFVLKLSHLHCGAKTHLGGKKEQWSHSFQIRGYSFHSGNPDCLFLSCSNREKTLWFLGKCKFFVLDAAWQKQGFVRFKAHLKCQFFLLTKSNNIWLEPKGYFTIFHPLEELEGALQVWVVFFSSEVTGPYKL